MSVRSGQSVTVEFTTASPTTLAAANADSTPTGTLVVNGADNAASVTVTNVDTGRYKAAVTMPTLAIGDIVELLISATVGGVAGKANVWRDSKDVLLDSSGKVTDNQQTGDAYARLGAPVGASTSADIASIKTDTGTTIPGRLPASLVSGRIDASVGAMATGVLTATAIAADAITDAKVASDVTIASVTGAVGSVTGNVGGNVAGSVGSIATGGIAAASFAAGAINAAAIAADAIGASELAADAVAEIQSGLSTLTQANVRTAVGLASANLDTQLAAIQLSADSAANTAASAETYALSARNTVQDVVYGNSALNTKIGTPAGASVSVDIAAVKTDTGNLINRLGAFAGSGLNTVLGFFRALMRKTAALTPSDVGGTFDNTTDSLEAIKDAGGGGASAADIADAVWDEVISGHLTSGTTGAKLNSAASAGDPWSTALPGSYGVGEAGTILGNLTDNLAGLPVINVPVVPTIIVNGQKSSATIAQVTEGSTLKLNAYSQKADGTFETPASLRYRIDDVKSASQVLGWTNATPGDPTTFTIAAATNAMSGDGNNEKHCLTVESTFTDTTKVTGEWFFQVERVKFLGA